MAFSESAQASSTARLTGSLLSYEPALSCTQVLLLGGSHATYAAVGGDGPGVRPGCRTTVVHGVGAESAPARPGRGSK